MFNSFPSIQFLICVQPNLVRCSLVKSLSIIPYLNLFVNCFSKVFLKFLNFFDALFRLSGIGSLSSRQPVYNTIPFMKCQTFFSTFFKFFCLFFNFLIASCLRPISRIFVQSHTQNTVFSIAAALVARRAILWYNGYVNLLAA